MSILRSFARRVDTAFVVLPTTTATTTARSTTTRLPTLGYQRLQRFSTAGRLGYPVEGVPEHLDEKEAGIFEKLKEGLSPSRLDVKDISGGCGSMYAVEIESPKFRGLTTLKMHREVQGILAEEIKGWHGIQLKTKATPVGEE
ncbi:hypothetical protein TWF102_004479 [Orbilia oligospora]|uniref:Bola-like protein n=1 Tax=Orbilia oligospora TaxID=2813651 RepID=A0A7C8IYX6_ORBOL|nr:hypothetical protein TWF102_004479 [Orbilia oligospora]KAF3093410.1 hypothetical protein TWF103_010953 [Orbilia oligospora]KAF3107797.1 hypothetical protein TWF706_002611 [Orbilia oligospora]